MVGSEGTLGVITSATLKLLPLPQFQALMFVPFENVEMRARAVSSVFRAGVMPSAMEFMESDAMRLAQEFTRNFELELKDEHEAYLLVEVDGFSAEDLNAAMRKDVASIRKHNCGEILFANSAAEQEKLWFLRRRVGEAVKAESVYKEEDTVVPRGLLPQLMKVVKRIGGEYEFRSICYGHAGDGNLAHQHFERFNE